MENSRYRSLHSSPRLGPCLAFHWRMGREYDPPLDDGLERIVEILQRANVETFESCNGATGHAFPEPTLRFHGGVAEGFRALAVALQADLPVNQLRRTWRI